MSAVTPEKFTACVPQFLRAVGDGVQLVVSRALACSVHSEGYEPVRRYIADTGMVLCEREVVQSEDRMFGRVERSHYAIPEVRNLLMTYPEETTA